MKTNNFNLKTSHFVPALIIKIYLAKIKKNDQIFIWGTGRPKRELMYVDDLADACIYFLRKKTKETLINVGSSIEMTINDYARFIIKKLDANVKIKFDKSKPDGTPRKIVDSSIARKYGWRHKIDIDKGFDLTLNYVKNNFDKLMGKII